MLNIDRQLRTPCWSVLAAAALLSGCASTAVVVPPLAVDVPAAWAAGDGRVAAGTSRASWWQTFNDALLNSLVAQALQSSTRVDIAQATLRQARATRDVSAAGLLPDVGGSASAQRSRSGNNGSSNSLRVGLDASWELDVFGANRSALATSEASLRASAASLADVQVSIAAEVALAYLSLRNAQARLAIANDNLASQQETLQLTQWREQAGLATALETEQARGAVEQTRAQRPGLQTSIEQTGHALALLVGQPPAALSAQLAAARDAAQPARHAGQRGRGTRRRERRSRAPVQGTRRWLGSAGHGHRALGR